MFRKLMVTSLLVVGTAIGAGSPAYAGGWTYTGPHGATVSHWGPGWGGWGGCCYHPGVAAGVVAGAAVGTAVALAARPVAPPVVYAPPPVVYAPPPVVYAPWPYYYAR